MASPVQSEMDQKLESLESEVRRLKAENSALRKGYVVMRGALRQNKQVFKQMLTTTDPMWDIGLKLYIDTPPTLGPI